MAAKNRAPSPTNTGLRIERVTKTINDAWLLQPTTLTAEPGQCIAIQGPNGAGKSTLLRIIAGHIEPSSGTATWQGRIIDERDDAMRRSIGCYIDPPATYSDLNLADHLTLLAGTWGVAGPRSIQAVLDSLDRLGIRDLARRFPHELSSGQSQLFFLSMAFLLPRDILILDEPEQRLDANRRTILGTMINAACADGALVIMASHNPELVAQTATAVLNIAAHD